ncbi:MAG: anaerobic ribonucleoside-triphosphate reductase activating protein [Clostridia bacterium]|nr:anaerobic ribonucleoside-triphosphate reductase activating protein [Clostridia bacterium]
MKIGGLQKLTLLDFPGRCACTVFTVGCNLRCPFCHNASLVTGQEPSLIDEQEVFSLLQKRKGVLDGVCLTGGEPLLQPDLPDFIRRVRDLGFAVKLDTNGTLPDRLRALLEEGLLDYVAMDIKNAPERYAETVGVPGFDVKNIEQSMRILQNGKVPFEFRTTVVRELHDPKDFQKIAEWIGNDVPYFLQQFVDSGALLGTGFSAYSKAEMEAFLPLVAPKVPRVAIRGV